ncbi:DNA-binding response regulator [Desulfuromonas versatilis]|uniref:DNA-binding response regulator n=1 Tax=Desulfuromonas versatilis TaxID=2802975 RepID=A0ABM8HRW9_9BACT|nr:response regulator transcription factor [Desulfuromonas versatilis]BCR05786.1 DNA-binding response regulator [Desulfuromonas versatilis]
MPIRLLICCRNYLLAEGLGKLLEDAEQLVVGGVTCRAEELTTMLRDSPDVVLCDRTSCEHVFTQNLPVNGTKVLLLANEENGPFNYVDLQEMVAKGLAGIMPFDSDSQLLKKAIVKLHAGELWIDHKTISNALVSKSEEKPNIRLTKKEAEILKYVCAGDTNKKIAQRLNISEQTVKSHCNHLFKKFGVKNRVKLALQASRSASKFLNAGTGGNVSTD